MLSRKFGHHRFRRRENFNQRFPSIPADSDKRHSSLLRLRAKITWPQTQGKNSGKYPAIIAGGPHNRMLSPGRIREIATRSRRASVTRTIPPSRALRSVAKTFLSRRATTIKKRNLKTIASERKLLGIGFRERDSFFSLSHPTAARFEPSSWQNFGADDFPPRRWPFAKLNIARIAGAGQRSRILANPFHRRRQPASRFSVASRFSRCSNSAG